MKELAQANGVYTSVLFCFVLFVPHKIYVCACVFASVLHIHDFMDTLLCYCTAYTQPNKCVSFIYVCVYVCSVLYWNCCYGKKNAVYAFDSNPIFADCVTCIKFESKTAAAAAVLIKNKKKINFQWNCN